MPNNYFISGPPKSGKTTLLRKLVQKMREKGLRIGGFLSPDEKSHGRRTGFFVEDIATGRVEMLAAEDIDGPKVSKYHVNIKTFESLAVPALEGASKYDVIIIDEIGRMEMKSMKFGDLLTQVLESDVPVVAALNRDYIESYRSWGEVQMLTPSSRSRIYLDLLEKVMKYKRRTAAKAGKKAKAAKKRVKPAKKGKKSKAKTRKERGELDRMAEDLLRYKPKQEEAEERGKKEERHPHHAKEEQHHGKEEEKEKKHEHKGKRHHVREWIREHVGV
jgi:nucleoside-triphosphatase